MNVYVDISLLYMGDDDCGSVGRIYGDVSLVCVPYIGSTVSFYRPKAPTLSPCVKGFKQLIRVTSLLISANDDDAGVSAMLEDIVVQTREDGLKVAKFFEDGFGLNFDEHDE